MEDKWANFPEVARAYHCQFANTKEQQDHMAWQGLPGNGYLKKQFRGEVQTLAGHDPVPWWFVREQIGSTTVMKFSDDDDPSDSRGFYLKTAWVITLPELLEIMPPTFVSLFAAYSWWLGAPKIVKSKARELRK